MVFMLLGTGFEETEAITPLDLLRRAGVNILTVGIDGKCAGSGTQEEQHPGDRQRHRLEQSGSVETSAG